MKASFKSPVRSSMKYILVLSKVGVNRFNCSWTKFCFFFFSSYRLYFFGAVLWDWNFLHVSQFFRCFSLTNWLNSFEHHHRRKSVDQPVKFIWLICFRRQSKQTHDWLFTEIFSTCLSQALPTDIESTATLLSGLQHSFFLSCCWMRNKRLKKSHAIIKYTNSFYFISCYNLISSIYDFISFHISDYFLFFKVINLWAVFHYVHEGIFFRKVFKITLSQKIWIWVFDRNHFWVSQGLRCAWYSTFKCHLKAYSETKNFLTHCILT